MAYENEGYEIAQRLKAIEEHVVTQNEWNKSLEKCRDRVTALMKIIMSSVVLVILTVVGWAVSSQQKKDLWQDEQLTKIKDMIIVQSNQYFDNIDNRFATVEEKLQKCKCF